MLSKERHQTATGPLSHLLIVVAAPTAIITISADRHKSITMGIWATFFGVAYAVTGFGGVPILENYGLSS